MRDIRMFHKSKYKELFTLQTFMEQEAIFQELCVLLYEDY